MNKAELVRAVEDRLQTDRKTAAHAVDSVVDIVIRSIIKGEKVSITGFGVFEKRARKARTARNPATGATVKVKATSVPAFRAGAGFKELVSGAKKLPKATAASKTTAAKKTAATKSATTGKSAATRSTTAKKGATTRKSTGAKRSTAAKAGATIRKTATAKRSTAAKRGAAKRAG